MAPIECECPACVVNAASGAFVCLLSPHALVPHAAPWEVTPPRVAFHGWRGVVPAYDGAPLAPRCPCPRCARATVAEA